MVTLPTFSTETERADSAVAIAATPVVNVTAVTITDRNFFIAVFVLILSLKYHRVRARVNVLSVGLTAQEKAWLEQFEDVAVVEADPVNKRGPASRKGEAMLTALDDTTDFIALLDGDCIATGDITPYLEAGTEALFANTKSPQDDGRVFRTRYAREEKRGTIPRSILEKWRADVGENPEPAIKNTACGGNLIIHRKHLGFIQKWQKQMLKVLPESVQGAHDFGSHAYFQVDESVLNSLLAFAADAPPLRKVMLDSNPDAYLAHLGPNHPKPWELWRPEKLKYYPQVVAFIEWAEREGYAMPPIPWTFRRRNAWLVYPTAHLFGTYKLLKRLAGLLLKKRR